MSIGAIVDYCITYNNAMHSEKEETEKPRKRRATQADWDALFGG